MTDLKKTVDALGAINEEIKALESAARKLKAELIQQGVGEYGGELYRAEVQFFDSELIKPDLVREILDAESLRKVTVTKSNERVVVRAIA
jgi:hypothetical protein